MAGFPKSAPPKGQDGTPFTPPVPSPLIMEQFQGMFTSTSRVGVKDEQCWNIDGYIPIGPQFLRTLPGAGPLLWTIPVATISFFGFASIGSTPYAIVISSNGGIYAVNTNTGGASLIGPVGTIQNPSRQNVGISQFGSTYIIVVAKQTNGYFLYDGLVFYNPGDALPGGGTVPTAIGGTAVETYSGRVWVANGATVFFSAPGSVYDFSSGSGGGNFTSTDSFLRVAYIQLLQTNGFLYLIADSSLNYISGVQTSGSPPVTTFTNQNADPQVGTPYPATVSQYGRNIVFANAWGVQVSYGAAVSKISDALDGFYASVPNFAGQQISSAQAIVYSKKLWMLLLPIIDLFTGQQRNKLAIWDGKTWFLSEQDIPLTYIQHQEINSVITAYGTDGTTLRPLFQRPSTGFTKRVMSKFWTGPVGYQTNKEINRFYAIAQYFTFDSPDVTVYLETENASAQNSATLVPETENSEMTWTTPPSPMTWTTANGDPMIWSAISTGIILFGPKALGQQGVLNGFSLSTDCSDMAWISAMVQPVAVTYRG